MERRKRKKWGGERRGVESGGRERKGELKGRGKEKGGGERKERG